MADYIVFGRWFPVAGHSTQLAEELEQIVHYSRSNQEQIPCVYVLKEVRDGDDIEVLTVSCFKNDSVYQKFRQSDLFLQTIHKCESASILKSPQRDEILELAAGFPYREQDSTNALGPYVVIASIRYEPGTRDEGVKYWTRVTDSVEKNEEGTLGYCFLKSCEDENILFSMERYKSKEYFLETHVPSEAIQNNIKLQKDIRSPGGLSHRVWEELGNSR